MKIMGVIPARVAGQPTSIVIRDTSVSDAWWRGDRVLANTSHLVFVGYIASVAREHGVECIAVDGGSPLGPVMHERLHGYYAAQAPNEPPVAVTLVHSTHAALGLTYQAEVAGPRVPEPPASLLPGGAEYAPSDDLREALQALLRESADKLARSLAVLFKTRE